MGVTRMGGTANGGTANKGRTRMGVTRMGGTANGGGGYELSRRDDTIRILPRFVVKGVTSSTRACPQHSRRRRSGGLGRWSPGIWRKLPRKAPEASLRAARYSWNTVREAVAAALLCGMECAEEWFLGPAWDRHPMVVERDFATSDGR
jgi:hypothetical protein